MSDVPKFVRQRMMQAGGGEHPDPNLLAALSEGGLTRHEREQVLGHLGSCAACREILALASPENTQQVLSPVSVGARWLRWPMLRWAGIGAAVVVVGAAVVIQSSRRPVEAPASSAGVRAEESQAGKEKAAANSPASAPAAESRKGPASSTALSKVAPVVSGRLQTRTAQAPEKDLAASRDQQAKKERLADELEDKKQAPEMASAAPAPPRQDDNKLGQVNEPGQAEVKRRSYSAVESAKAQQQGGSVHGGQVAGIVAAEQKPRQAPPPAPQAGSLNESAEAAGQAAAVQTPQAKSQDRGRSGLDVVSNARESGRATKTKAGTSGRSITPSSTAPLSGPLMKAALSVSPHWRLSTEGALERSTDDGRSWHLVRVATPQAALRSFSAVDRDIWAGGSGGALYHSADNGWTWTRVAAQAGDTALDVDIVRVEFTDLRHGMVTTSTGERWTTEDGGASWSVSR